MHTDSTVLRNDIRWFVGEKKRDVYITKFKTIKEGGTSWNWCAFLFPHFWLLYRKMFCWFFLMFGFSVAVSLAVDLMCGYRMGTAVATLNAASCVIQMLFPGFFGDRLYLRHIEKILDKYPQKKALKKGGTSKAAVVVYIVFPAALAALMIYVLLYYGIM